MLFNKTVKTDSTFVLRDELVNCITLKGGGVMYLAHTRYITPKLIQFGIKKWGDKFKWGCCNPEKVVKNCPEAAKYYVLGPWAATTSWNLCSKKGERHIEFYMLPKEKAIQWLFRPIF